MRLNKARPCNFVVGWIEQLESGNIDEVMFAIVDGLNRFRRTMPLKVWRTFVESSEVIRLRGLLHECPYTSRGFSKPRGYPGDAVLLDYVYGMAPLPDETSEQGKQIYRWCLKNSVAFKSVRARRRYLASVIDSAPMKAPRILAVACGHLREAALSTSVVSGEIEELIALDQDELSLAVVRGSCDSAKIKTVCASVAHIIKNKVDIGTFDVVYAAGLYDYLDRQLARLLTQRLFRMLRPHGSLIVANFMSLWEAGYMEAVMSWNLVYRDDLAMEEIMQAVDSSEIASSATSIDEFAVLAYSVIIRR